MLTLGKRKYRCICVCVSNRFSYGTETRMRHNLDVAQEKEPNERIMLNVSMFSFRISLAFGIYIRVPTRQHSRASTNTYSSIAIKTIYVRSYVCHKVLEEQRKMQYSTPHFLFIYMCAYLKKQLVLPRKYKNQCVCVRC